MHRPRFTATLFVLLVSLPSAPLSAVAQMSFTKHVIDPGLSGAYWVQGTDMDGDGDMDLVTASSGGIDWYENNGSGSFSRHWVGSFDGVWHVYAADIDRDGDVDVVGASSTLMEVAWWENTGGFTKRSLGHLQNAESVFAADLDGDGDLDILAAGWGDNAIARWENRGGSFVRRDLDNNLTGAHSVYGADFDGDGDIDVVGAGSGSVAWYRNDGRGNFSGPMSIGGEGALCVFSADVDRSGTKDVLSTGRSSENINFFPNGGGGGFGQQVIASGFGNSWTVHAADVDGDGALDVLSGGLYNHKVVVWYNRGGFTEQVIDPNAGEIRSVFGGDFNRDGDADVAVAIRNPGQLVWYEAQGSTSPASLRVTSPNGGETWLAGSTHEITWTSSGSVGDLRIEFSSNAGTSWQTVVSSTPNDGYFSWTVPEVISNDCLIRISEAADGSPSDVSDGRFSITGPSITVLFPNGGEDLPSGSVYTVRWTSSGFGGNVRIEFSGDGGSAWSIVAPSVANSGSYDWAVPDVNSNNCLIRISDAVDETPSDVSDGTFSIALPPSPTITVLKPSGGEVILAGTQYRLQWTSTGAIDRVTIEFSANAGASWTTIERDTPNDGETFWNVPNELSQDCLVRISDAIDGLPSDESDGTFAIVQDTDAGYALSFDGVDDEARIPDSPSLSGGLGKSITVEVWAKVTDVSRHNPLVTKFLDTSWKEWGIEVDEGQMVVDIENDGDNWAVVGGSVSSGVWTHLAFTFDNPSNTVRLYINGTEVGSGASQPKDMPDTNAPVSLGYHYGNYRAAAVIDEVRVWNYARNVSELRGDMNRVLNGNEQGLVGYWRFDEGSGQSSADLTGNGNTVQLGTSTGSEASDPAWVVSDAPLSTAPFVRVTSPNGGERWEVGSNQDVTWSASGSISNVRLEFSRDNGRSWGEIISSTPNDGSYSWQVPDAPSDSCRVRVLDAADGDPSDVSDNVFSITVPPLPGLTVISPNGGERWTVGSSQAIRWSSQGNIAQVKLEFSRDGGGTWQTIASSVGNTGSYGWTIPDAVSDNCLVRVSDAADGAPSDVSDGVFSITAVQAGYALQFDGVNDVARIGDNALLSGGSGKSLTVEAWVKLGSVSGNYPLVTKFLDTSWKDWGLTIEGGRVVVDIENNGDNWVYVAGSVSAGVWSHVAFTFDNPGNRVRIYVNGAEAGSGASLLKDMPDTPAPILIGAHAYNGTHLASVVDEVRIWNYARSGSELQADMNRTLGGNESGLIGYWRFDEGSGQSSADLTGNGNTVQLGTSTGSEASDPAWVVSDAPIEGGAFGKEADSRTFQRVIPTAYSLMRNQPNPFNSQTKIVYHLPRPTKVSIVLYDLLGRKVKCLVDEEQEAGVYTVIWEGQDQNGQRVPSGVYVYSMETEDYRASRKLVLLK